MRPMSAFHDIIVPLAKSLGHTDYAIEKWRVRGRVPYRWRLPLIEAAKRRGKKLDPKCFDGIDHDVKRRRAA